MRKEIDDEDLLELLDFLELVGNLGRLEKEFHKSDCEALTKKVEFMRFKYAKLRLLLDERMFQRIWN